MRALDVDLANIQDDKLRRYAYKVYIYDFVSTKGFAVPDNISRLVQGATLNVLAGPLDITNSVSAVVMTERSSDVAQGTIQGNSISVNIVDRGTVYDPVNGTESRWLKPGNGIRILEGDSSLDESKWVLTFTGTIIGRAGAEVTDRAGNVILQVAAEDRTSSLLKLKTTSQNFPQGTDYQFIMSSILEDEVGMAQSEFDLGNLGAQLTTQSTTQIVDESPILSEAKFAFLDGFVPRFNGEGVMVFSANISSKGADIVYANEDPFEGFSRPFSPLEDVNEVEIIGLEAVMTKVPQPTQSLATAGVTLGFFGGDASIPVQWSSDKTQQADNARLEVISSVTGALIPFGAESFTLVVDDDSGSRSGRIEVEGAFYAPLVVVLYALAIVAQYIPDIVIVVGIGASSGVTKSVGRILETVAALAIALVQATIGRGDYAILGEPYEYVFQEIRGVARVGQFAFVDIRGISVENHLIDTQLEADAIALRELRTARKRGNLYNTVMVHDLRLEPLDKFSLPNGREFMILEINRTLSRSENQISTMALFETTFGVNP